MVARALRVDQLEKLRGHVSKATSHFRRIAILIDNLDKTWEEGADFKAISRFILALLVASGRIEKEVGRPKAERTEELRVTLAIFLRTDILDTVRGFAREPDKIGARTVDWADEQLLVRVLEDATPPTVGPERQALCGPSCSPRRFTGCQHGTTSYGARCADRGTLFISRTRL